MGRRLSRKKRQEQGCDELVSPRGKCLKFPSNFDAPDQQHFTSGQLRVDRQEALRMKECNICLQTGCTRRQKCCGYYACRACVNKYHNYQRIRGVRRTCPQCRAHLPDTRDTTRSTPNNTRAEWEQFDVNAACKHCPRCYEEHIKQGFIETMKHAVWSSKITCPQCDLVWCFKCHVPYHVGMSCSQFSRGDKEFILWSQRVQGEGGKRNATSCPKCGLWFQLSGGCINMTCTVCKTKFCYECGRGREFPRFPMSLAGAHYEWWSVIGCEKLLLKNHPCARLITRIFLTTFAYVAGFLFILLILFCGVSTYKFLKDYIVGSSIPLECSESMPFQFYTDCLLSTCPDAISGLY